MRGDEKRELKTYISYGADSSDEVNEADGFRERGLYSFAVCGGSIPRCYCLFFGLEPHLIFLTHGFRS